MVGAVKFIETRRIIELTERNITALLAKLGDPLSARMLISPDGGMAVRAVEDDATRNDEAAAPACSVEGIVMLTRDELWSLTVPGATVMVGGFTVRSVPDLAHYEDRRPGHVYMPESGASW